MVHDATMHISWHGDYTVKLQTKQHTILIDPGKALRSNVDVVALSGATEIEVDPTDGMEVINSPGEYSLDGLSLTALGWHTAHGDERSLMLWVLEGMVVLYLGSLDRALSDEELQVLEKTTIDVLILGVGEKMGLPEEDAVKLVSTIDPRIVVPLYTNKIDHFAEEMGVAGQAAQDKLTLKPNSLPEDERLTVLLKK